MIDWIRALAASIASGAPSILVTIVAAKGSAPRRPGTRMIVTPDAIHGTIGGGQLEYKAIAIARDLLAGSGTPTLQRFPLGASLGQCCGGVVELLFEVVALRPDWLDTLTWLDAEGVACALVTPLRGDVAEHHLIVTSDATFGTIGSAESDGFAVTAARAALATNAASRIMTPCGAAPFECYLDVLRPTNFRIVLFGAGHVGRAIVNALAGLRCRITWIDTRDDAFPTAIPANVDCVATDTPDAEVSDAPPGAYFLVMTHSHALDEDLALRILARNDFAYFGLIGSRSKRRQFERRMEARGMPRSRFARMTCPIGIPGIGGKEPEVIAIAVAAELLQIRGGKAIDATGLEARRA